MLGQTKEQIQELVNKIQILDFTLNALNPTHKDHGATTEELFRRGSFHKLKLIDEVLRLNGAVESGPMTLAPQVVEAEVVQ